MTYRFKVQLFNVQESSPCRHGNRFDERHLSFVRHTAITLSGRQTHRHPFSASPFAVHAMGRDRSRAFQKHNLDFDLVFIASSPSVTAAMLGGDAEISLGGGEGPIRAYVQGASDFVFVAGFKNVLTHSILARPI